MGVFSEHYALPERLQGAIFFPSPVSVAFKTASPQLKPLLFPARKAANIAVTAITALGVSSSTKNSHHMALHPSGGPPGGFPPQLSSSIFYWSPCDSFHSHPYFLLSQAHKSPLVSLLFHLAVGLYPTGLKGLYFLSFKTQERAGILRQKHQWFNA